MSMGSVEVNLSIIETSQFGGVKKKTRGAAAAEQNS